MSTPEQILARFQGVHLPQQFTCSLAFTMELLNWNTLLSSRKNCIKCCTTRGITNDLVAVSHHFERHYEHFPAHSGFLQPTGWKPFSGMIAEQWRSS
jgi:hypothetical protein